MVTDFLNVFFGGPAARVTTTDEDRCVCAPWSAPVRGAFLWECAGPRRFPLDGQALVKLVPATALPPSAMIGKLAEETRVRGDNVNGLGERWEADA